MSTVSFWLNVGLAYLLLLLGLGLAAGAFFGARGRRDGRGFGGDTSPLPNFVQQFGHCTLAMPGSLHEVRSEGGSVI